MEGRVGDRLIPERDDGDLDLERRDSVQVVLRRRPDQIPVTVPGHARNPRTRSPARQRPATALASARGPRLTSPRLRALATRCAVADHPITDITTAQRVASQRAGWEVRRNGWQVALDRPERTQDDPEIASAGALGGGGTSFRRKPGSRPP